MARVLYLFMKKIKQRIKNDDWQDQISLWSSKKKKYRVTTNKKKIIQHFCIFIITCKYYCTVNKFSVQFKTRETFSSFQSNFTALKCNSLSMHVMWFDVSVRKWTIIIIVIQKMGVNFTSFTYWISKIICMIQKCNLFGKFVQKKRGNSIINHWLSFLIKSTGECKYFIFVRKNGRKATFHTFFFIYLQHCKNQCTSSVSHWNL